MAAIAKTMSQTDIETCRLEEGRANIGRKQVAAYPMTRSLSLSDEVNLRGKSTVQWTLDPFDFPELKSRRILSLGYSEAGMGYQVVRQRPIFSNINITVSGSGQAFIRGKWTKISSGMATLSPKGVFHAAQSLPGRRWEFCWICFTELEGTAPRIALTVPTVTYTDPRPIAWTLRSLHSEMRHARQKVILNSLLQILELYLQRIMGPWPTENHLWKLWDRVSAMPAYEWNDDALAQEAHLSSRHLLRLCKKESGRTLQEQVSHIRLTRAASLLQSRALKLQAVAEAVGYRDAFSFSKAFKRWSGLSPKSYRSDFKEK